MELRWAVAGSGVFYGLVGLMLSVSGCEARADDAGERDVKTVKVTPLREAKGKVRALDTAEKTVDVELRDRTARFKVNGDTVFFSPGRQAQFEDLTEGQEIRVVYETGDAEPALQWVEFGKASSHRGEGSSH